MKKLLALLLAASLIALTTACSDNKGNGEDTKAGDDTTVNSTEKVEFSRGTIDGDVYNNAFLGFKFTKPESWVYSTDEEIASAMGMGAEALGKDYKELLESNAAVFDMMVVDSLTGSNINVTYENLSKSFSTNITVEQYIDAVEQQLSGLADATFDISDEFETVTLGANEYTRVIMETTMYGIDMQEVYYLRKMDTYMSGIIVTIVDGYSIEDIEAMFE